VRPAEGGATLPIAAALPELLAVLKAGPNVVLVAPPGAGKTTAVPLALLAEPWFEGRILMLEPRRLAAKAAARRMAATWGEEPGETIGYRVRLETKISARTRIEVVTDGVFTRMIQADPGLDGVGAVLFDEFHERRLETDLGLALALDAQAAIRPDLRLLVMSATLEADPVATLLGGAKIIRAEGRAHPVTFRHLPAPGAGRLTDGIVAGIRAALDHPGGILVFLPGAAEIRRVERALRESRLPAEIDIHTLFGDLSPAAQDQALAPAPPGRRKIVLATSIAETSLTIDGILQVVDSGLARSGRFDPRTGMSRLVTGPVSQDAASQRAGRAGRVAPGIAWRLWPEAAHGGLPARREPEIAAADLAPLALELAAWGLADPGRLRLLDQPPAPVWAAARDLLVALRAIDGTGRITAHGRAMASLGVAPRLAHMILVGAARGEGVLACAIAAILTEREPGRGDTDLRARLERLADPRGDSARLREVARRLARQAGIRWGEITPAGAGALLAEAFPERIAKRRPEPGRFRLAGGQGAVLPEGDPLATASYLAIAELDGTPPESRIWLAASLTGTEIEAGFAERIETADEIRFEPATATVQARRRRRLGALVLAETVLRDPPPAEVAHALLDGIRRQGLAILPWTHAARSVRARIGFLASRDGAGAWPGMADAELLASLDDWLGPALGSRRSIADLAGLDLAGLLLDRLDWPRRQALDRRAPKTWTVPTGRDLAIDYESGPSPILAVKLQEMFGTREHPAIDDGRVRLVLHLLSPAQRPIQVTSDLAGFWAGSYKAVRADLRGRYPRHPWPDDPLTAPPTARAKPRGG
jgi:ATP-dependent helicase HrpB